MHLLEESRKEDEQIQKEELQGKRIFLLFKAHLIHIPSCYLHPIKRNFFYSIRSLKDYFELNILHFLYITRIQHIQQEINLIQVCSYVDYKTMDDYNELK